jgi:hypothetical protein
MNDKLDALSDLLLRLSRVPGLGFLQDHATSLTNLKHTVEGHIGDFEVKKQGLEEGAEILRESVRRKPKAGTAVSAPSRPAAGGDPREGETGGDGSEKVPMRDGKSKMKTKPKGDLAAQKKMLQRKLKR